MTHSSTSGYATNLTGGASTPLPTSDTKNNYYWGDGLKLSSVVYKPNATGTTVYTST